MHSDTLVCSELRHAGGTSRVQSQQEPRPPTGLTLVDGFQLSHVAAAIWNPSSLSCTPTWQEPHPVSVPLLPPVSMQQVPLPYVLPVATCH